VQPAIDGTTTEIASNVLAFIVRQYQRARGQGSPVDSDSLEGSVNVDAMVVE
jgi:hypothetical protein